MFTKFPEFSPVSEEHRDIYNRRIVAYPPFSDLSFTTLNMWWNLDGSLRMSTLNGNIILSYSAPDDVVNSGVSIVGTKDIDSTVDAVFCELRQQNKPVRLVHVPDFVVEGIVDRERFNIEEERDYDEYILPVEKLYPQSAIPLHDTRRKISKFVREVGNGQRAEMRELDITNPGCLDLVLSSYKKWPAKTSHSSDEDWEFRVMRKALANAKAWGIHNSCLFVDGKLNGFVLYQMSASGDCMILNHLRVNYELPYAFIYVLYCCAERAGRLGAKSLNIEMDLGIPGLRFFKSHITSFTLLRKYTIAPKF